MTSNNNNKQKMGSSSYAVDANSASSSPFPSPITSTSPITLDRDYNPLTPDSSENIPAIKGNLFSGENALARLMRGVDAVADSVRGTLGAAGYNGLLEAQEYPFSLTTNDGVSIARAIKLDDPVEQMGARLMQEIASRSDKQSNDGTTTAITLAQAILHEGMKADIPPMQLKRELEDCLPIIEASIDSQTKQIDVKEVAKVAGNAAEDAQIGALIQEIYEKIGRDGILFRDISQTFTDHYTISKGIHIEDAGYASPYMVDIEKDTGKPLSGIQLKKPYAIVTKKLNSISDLESLALSLRNKVNELVIFCEDYEALVLAQCAGTRMKSGFRFIVVKLPILWRDQWLEDIAKMTGATLIDGTSVILKSIKESMLGTCESIDISKDGTFFGGIQDITAHLATLEADGTDDSKIRVARLNKNSARLYVGATSDQALSYRRLKVEDAVGSAWSALHGGIVAGGGVALLNASRVMPDTIGGAIMEKALESPVLQICINGGHPEVNVNVKWDFGGTRGYDAKRNEITDMLDAGIVDAATVVKASIRNALSVSAAILSTKVIVTLPKT